MSRSGYVEDIEDQWAWICWRGAVKSAIRGRRGQVLLKDILSALDALPEKRLAAGSLQTPDGEFCTLGAVGAMRGLEMAEIDAFDYTTVATAFGVAEAMAREIVYMNDEASWSSETPEARWQRMRDWASSKLTEHATRDDGPDSTGKENP